MDTTTFAALRTELQTDPEHVGYAALAVDGKHRLEAVHAALHLERDGTYRERPLVPKSEVQDYLVGEGLLAVIDRTARNDATDTRLQSICIQVVNTLRGDYSAFDLGQARTVAAIDALISAGLATSAQKTALLALARVKCSRAEAVCGAPVSRDDLLKAMQELGWEVV